jgi:isoleucyl-tRNA synthetase
MPQENTDNLKSAAALREEKVLEFWKSQNIFEKTLQKVLPNSQMLEI